MIATSLFTAVTVLGLAQGVAADALLRRFLRREPERGVRPVSVLKPVSGDEPLLEAALETLFSQDHPEFQIVFGLQNPADPARAVIDRLCARYPARDVAVVVDPTKHGANGKVSNLINMLPAARHAILVIADSDVHAPQGWLADVVATLETEGTGLATALYTGLAANDGPLAALGAAAITHGFLPGAVLGRALGRQDCFGSTMALRRGTLDAIGGFEALADHLADDHLLGVLVRREGLRVALARSIVATTVPEARLADLFRHELRWARTIRRLEPLGYAASVMQYPLFWAFLATLADRHFVWLFLIAWALRAWIATSTAQGVEQPTERRTPTWLWPMRDFLSVVVWGTSYLSDTVSWRGALLRAAPVPHETMGHQPQ